MVADVTVVGAGVIALAAAAELADRGVRVRLIGTAHRGEASSASAGMLAPSVEKETAEGPVRPIALASRDRYPDYLAALETRTGIPVPLNRLGILEIAFTDEEAQTLRARGRDGEVLGPHHLAMLEPALSRAAGGVLHPHDGALDPLLLMDALRLLVSRHERISPHSENVLHVHVTSDRCQVVTDRENRYASRTIVLAAGAWTPKITGVPRPLPVEPVRGQMVAFGASPLRHVVCSPHGYVVPKSDGNTLAGSTMECVGFDTETTDDGIAAVRAIGEEICPPLRTARVSAAWAGLRPMTPDLLPVLGPDPALPNVIYACGHSRNGILLTPVTAEVVADVATGASPRYDIAPFRPERFSY